MKFSVLSLALIPLCFAYAIIRYRLMDVDIIFKRGLAYTVATAGVVAFYFGLAALIGERSEERRVGNECRLRLWARDEKDDSDTYIHGALNTRCEAGQGHS